ncbi:tetraspanin [Elysia marginata]|uniref:Tetraspanin n=1 Tax=Elysia marginata TaxID=1093978 RepID=A0AAV4EUT1_9GAST|nr:tetraspanin [Elysia marginata]
MKIHVPKISADRLLIGSTFISLILGLLLITIGSSIHIDTSGFIELYGGSFDAELEPNVCVEPSTGIDFCSRRNDLSNHHLGDWVISLSSLVFITGFLVILFSLLGLAGAYCKQKALLLLMIAFACGSVRLEVDIHDILTNEQSQFHAQAKEELVKLLQQSYKFAMPENNSFTQAINLIMLQGECCGITGRADFGTNLTFTRTDGFVYRFLQKKFYAFVRKPGCSESPPSFMTEDDINTEGCYDTIFRYVSDVYGDAANGIMFYLIISHSFAVVLAMMMMMMHTKPQAPQISYIVVDSEVFSLLSNDSNKDDKKTKRNGLNGQKESGAAKNGSSEIW